MSRRTPRLPARRRAIVLVCLAALVWCQMAVASHASSMTLAQLAADQVAAQMALMPGCHDTDGGDQESQSHCPTTEAMPDWSKLSALHAVRIPHGFALEPVVERGFSGQVHYGLPRGRAPPRAQLCRWLI